MEKKESEHDKIQEEKKIRKAAQKDRRRVRKEAKRRRSQTEKGQHVIVKREKGVGA